MDDGSVDDSEETNQTKRTEVEAEEANGLTD